jgi:hypothetical protein
MRNSFFAACAALCLLAGAASAQTSMPLRWGGIGGSWLMPSGDASDFAEDGFGITLFGNQFLDPNRRVAAGAEFGYYDLGAKDIGAGIKADVSMFPVDFVVKIFPTQAAQRARPYAMGGLGFYSVRNEAQGPFTSTSYYDYDFATQAGGGLMIRTNGPVAIDLSGVYHWVFAPGDDPNFWALRGALMIPIAR